MLSKIPPIFWAATIITVIGVFYGYSHIQRQGNITQGRSLRTILTDKESKFTEPSSRFAGVETLRKAQMPELIAEVEKLLEQGGLPADVFVDDSATIGGDSINIAETLYELFQEYDTQSPDDLEELWEACPIGAWDVDKQTIDSVRETLARFEPKRQRIRTQLRQATKTRFYYIFRRPESLKSIFYVGIVVDTDASKYLADYALLEEFAVAQALLDGNIEVATEALAYIFRIAQLASQLANVGVRADAALVRLRAFEVMQRVVLDPKFDKAQMIILQKMLTEQFEYRTTEYIVWFGDRASSLSLYHRLLTTNGLENVFEPDELTLLESRGITDTFLRGFKKHHEADEVFYLRSMQQILDVCDKPLAKRLVVLNSVHNELIASEDQYDDAGIAMEYFTAGIILQHVDKLMRLFAQDESALNRTLAVMSRSLGQDNTDSYHDPFTDEPYEIRQVNGLLNVSGAVLDRPFQVPVFTNQESP